MRKNFLLYYCIFALRSSNPDDTTWEVPRAAAIFLGFPDFCSEKYFSSQKLILSMKILNKYIWQASIYMFCIKPTAETNNTGFPNFVNYMAESKRSWTKFGCFWLRWTCFGRTNCNSLFYEYSFSGHGALGAETSKVSSRCVGSTALTSGWDKRSYMNQHEAFQSSYLSTGMLIS